MVKYHKKKHYVMADTKLEDLFLFLAQSNTSVQRHELRIPCPWPGQNESKEKVFFDTLTK